MMRPMKPIAFTLALSAVGLATTYLYLFWYAEALYRHSHETVFRVFALEIAAILALLVVEFLMIKTNRGAR
jgi:hypothetical protein